MIEPTQDLDCFLFSPNLPFQIYKKPHPASTELWLVTTPLSFQATAGLVVTVASPRRSDLAKAAGGSLLVPGRIGRWSDRPTLNSLSITHPILATPESLMTYHLKTVGRPCFQFSLRAMLSLHEMPTKRSVFFLVTPGCFRIARSAACASIRADIWKWVRARCFFICPMETCCLEENTMVFPICNR